MIHKPNYFLISLSNKENLELCKKYAIAGFTNSINGVWTYSEINEGDFISFLYGAKAHNLYKVIGKEAIENSQSLGPWKPIVFKMSGKSYHFPFRLRLEPVREFCESLVRNEFSYVAENLLLRGGYRKTHFQTDQTTLQNVSQMGKIYKGYVDQLTLPTYSTFIPKFTKKRSDVSASKIFFFQEIILQSIIRQKLSLAENLDNFLNMIGIDGVKGKNLEILGEKALTQGHIDLLIKESIPIGTSKTIIVEVKYNKVTEKDFEQLNSYMQEIGEECIAGVLIAKDFSKKISAKFSNIVPVRYSLASFDSETFDFGSLMNNLILEKYEL